VKPALLFWETRTEKEKKGDLRKKISSNSEPMLKSSVIKSLDTAKRLGNSLKVIPHQSKTAIEEM
jgi:hypothetical protein